MIYNPKFNNNGFTLVEILVALALFSLVISIMVGIFVSGSASQRKIIELYTTQREAGYIIETVSRELRMATAICAVNADDGCALPRLEMENKETDKLEFKNYDEQWITYCRSLEDGSCDSGGDFISRDGKRISSSDVRVENLKFYTSDTFSQTQPLITIALKIKSTGKYGTSVILQDSISLRIYNRD